MKNGFKDPIAIRQGKKIKSPWNFDAPCYDERTSCYVNAGSHYGVGHRQPVGSHGAAKNLDNPPKGRVNTMQVTEIPNRNLEIELEQ